MATDEQRHTALPKLYGAPAYARPTVQTPEVPKPFDPDDLPLSAYQTSEEKDWVSELPARAYQAGGGIVFAGQGQKGSVTAADGSQSSLRGRPFRLKALAGKLLGTPSGR